MAKKDAFAAESVVVRHGKLRRSNGLGNALRILLTTALVVTLSGAATVAYAVWGTLGQLDTVDLGPEAVGAGTQDLDGAVTILLVGSDSRDGQAIDDGEEGELNDVTLMLHISEDHKNATVVSFPRDLMIPIPSCPGPNGEEGYYSAASEQQLNSTLSNGGLRCTVRTIEELTGMDIPYAGLIKFNGVIGVSDAIGGVDVCLAQPIEDPGADLSLPAGNNTLQGEQALQFLRTRYGVGDGGDTSRISNQQIFMSALVKQLQESDTLSDPVKAFKLANAALNNMTLSSNMQSVDFMLAMARTVKDIDLDHVAFVQYPAADHPYQAGRLTPKGDLAQEIFDGLKAGKQLKPTGLGEGVQVDGVDKTTVQPEVTGQDPAVQDPAVQDPGAQDPAAPSTTTPDPAASDVVELPSDITGVQANQSACSLGRTVN